ncbi:MAG: futalosine hydrolase [Planctomycetes bacterium]|nr:futalosine hydrolase [Planctomycetota bacterium]
MGSTPLILVPTAGERARLEALGGLGGLPIALCGFGPVAAAARSAQLLGAQPTDRVLLLGIAGTSAPDVLPIGGAAAFAAVALDGLGAGEGPGRLSATDLGFPQWEDAQGPVQGHLSLEQPLGPPHEQALLLTVCAASADAEQAAERTGRFGALAEDMEAFGVALGCRLQGASLAVVRGASNRTGDRETRGWRIDDALAAARRTALAVLEAWGAL